MKFQKIKTKVFDESCTLELADFEKADGKRWKELFDLWKGLKLGMRSYASREPNFPEGLSEVAFCLWSGSSRFVSAKGLSNTSFDTFNTRKNKAEQIKACSVKSDLTSFGPKSKWDDLYFLDFYNGGKTDGYFDVYLIPDEYIRNQSLNKTEKFTDQQTQKRRPRFSIKKEIIERYGIRPIGRSIKIW